MDAMQKRRMWKVAIMHFALSAFAFLALISYPRFHASENTNVSNNQYQQYQNKLNGFGQLQQHLIWQGAWQFFWLAIFQILQPQTLLIGKIWLHNGMSFELLIITQICFVFLWSICFGWLYVKFTNWLNHFPVLGRKLFWLWNFWKIGFGKRSDVPQGQKKIARSFNCGMKSRANKAPQGRQKPAKCFPPSLRDSVFFHPFSRR